MKPRDVYIRNRVKSLLATLPRDTLRLPVDIMAIANSLSNCRLMSYSEFADRHGLFVSDVVRYCESPAGATHYDRANDRYIIMYNDTSDNYNVQGRIRFTLAHEIGHVILDHLPYIAVNKIALDNLSSDKYPDFEKEADWCGSIILCPFPVLRKLNIKSPCEIKKLCGLSTQASLIKHEQYIDWLATRKKSAWENDIVRLFSSFIASYNNK